MARLHRLGYAGSHRPLSSYDQPANHQPSRTRHTGSKSKGHRVTECPGQDGSRGSRPGRRHCPAPVRDTQVLRPVVPGTATDHAHRIDSSMRSDCGVSGWSYVLRHHSQTLPAISSTPCLWPHLATGPPPSSDSAGFPDYCTGSYPSHQATDTCALDRLPSPPVAIPTQWVSESSTPSAD